uniref:3-beta hydroxysteroid dehydrogenase/isomerase domain-containing protein n=1 Tax=Palpitomonas bilix TaxID=652834 RepID=A0A7S3LVM1_9EUKA|mmetsp:Transcript_50052/g.128827  ORF Transcript_50052/g.128827 Transcript_50052/m.128827 type:complete len:145 (+) Transcript_50052:117-551(+)
MVVKGEKCMITGGLGFLGKNLVERLLRRGAHVRVLDLRLPATEIEETFKRLASDFGGKVEFFAGDLTKKDDCLLAVDGMDVIFHCASPRFMDLPPLKSLTKIRLALLFKTRRFSTPLTLVVQQISWRLAGKRASRDLFTQALHL